MTAHILIFDDDLDTLELYDILLREDEGYRLTTSTVSPTNFQYIEEVQPDLIILDIMYQGVARGLEVALALKSNPRFQLIPVILCSANTIALQTAQAQLEAATIAVLCKPFEITEFVNLIKERLATG